MVGKDLGKVISTGSDPRFKYDNLNCPVCDYHHEYRSLTCPKGTQSLYQSSRPDDCRQTGTVIAVSNVYRCYPPRQCWEEDFVLRNKDKPLPKGETKLRIPTIEDWCATFILRCDLSELRGGADADAFDNLALPKTPPKGGYRITDRCLLKEAEAPLCGKQFPETGQALEPNKENPAVKKSFVWGEKIENSRNIVNFLGYDPAVECMNFPYDCRWTVQKWNMKAMDQAVISFDFRGVKDGMRYNAQDRGHYQVYLMSNVYEEKLLVEGLTSRAQLLRGHTLPPYFRREVNDKVNDYFELKLFANSDMEVRIELHLLHGIHLENLALFNECIDIVLYSPMRSMGGTNRFFVALLDKELMNNGQYELPYNMPPDTAELIKTGEDQILIDLGRFVVNEAVHPDKEFDNAPQNIANDGEMRAKFNLQTQSNIFWNVARVQTVAMAWLPFFSSCEDYDSHIVIWDLFEQPQMRLQKRSGTFKEEEEGGGGGDDEEECATDCCIYEEEDVMPVPQLFINTETMALQLDPVADSCEFIIKCNYEEEKSADHMNVVWRELGLSETKLFYLTRDPQPYEVYQEEDGYCVVGGVFSQNSSHLHTSFHVCPRSHL